MKQLFFSEAPLKLRVLRESLNLSQRKFAKKLGVSHTQISELEKGSRDFTLSFINKASKTFGINPSYFLDDDEEEKRKYHNIPPEIAAELQLHAHDLTPEDHKLVVQVIRDAVLRQKAKQITEENPHIKDENC